MLYELWLTYGRVSSEEQAKLGYSISAQARACQERAEELGATKVEEYLDEGVPGDIINRPALMRLRDRVRKGGVAGVICYDPDRLARDLAYQLVLAEEIEKTGARLEFIDHDYKNTAEGKLFFQIRGAIAEYERAKITERTGRGKREKALKGLVPGQYKGYGYTLKEGHLLVNPETSPWLAQIFSWCAYDHLGLKAIARRLDDLGVPPNGKSSMWSRQAVRYILKNETYMGTLVIKYDQAGVKKNRFKPLEERVHKKLRPESEWLHIPVPPLVSREVFLAAQEQMHTNMGTSPEQYHPYLLTGMIYCGECGSPVRGKINHSGRTTPKRRVPYYVCNLRWVENRNGGPPCHLPSLKAEIAEGLVWQTVQGWMDNPAAYIEMVKQEEPPESESWRAELDQIAVELSDTQEERKRIVRMGTKGLIDDAEVDEMLREINNRVRRITERQARLDGLLVRDKKETALAERVQTARRRAAEANEDDVDLKRQIVRDLVEKVVLVDHEVRIMPRM